MMQKTNEKLSTLQKFYLAVPPAHAKYFKQCFLKLHGASEQTFHNRLKRFKPVDLALWFHVSGVQPIEPMFKQFCDDYKNTFRNIPTYIQFKEKIFQHNIETEL